MLKSSIDTTKIHYLTEDFTGKKPKGYIFKNHPYTTTTSWKDIYINICKYLIDENENKFYGLRNIVIGRKPYISKNPNKLFTPCLVKNGIYVDVKVCANRICKIITLLLNEYNIDITELKIILNSNSDTQNNIDNNEIKNNTDEFSNLDIIDGKSTSIQLTRYERDPKNRANAIKIHGTTCFACGFNFNNFYGAKLANNYIEIHHIKPVSQGEYIVNPYTDLVPLCSNCHAMIHKEPNPPQTINEIKNMYKINN